MHPSLFTPLLAAMLVLPSIVGAFAQQENGGVLSALKTVAEASGYKATATGRDTELYLKRLHRSWPGTRLESIGQTVEGREIWALVTPEVRGTDRPLTVLLLGGIHSGECDGKEALLALARDYASGNRAAAYDKLRLIFVPNFNADGNERMGVHHRPGQAGPEQGMGIRENAQGLDLNRDFVKLETPEVRSLVAALARWNVDVLIDTHTTNGSLHRYDLTYSVANHANTPRQVDRYLRDHLLPKVTDAMAASGFQSYYYGNFENDHQQWKSYGHEPRYGIELMGLRGKIGILAESYSYASYQRRIEATYAFVDNLLRQLQRDSQIVLAALDAAHENPSNDRSVAVRASLSPAESPAVVLGYRAADGSTPRGPYNAKSSSGFLPHDYRVQTWIQAEATRQVALPYAYAISTQSAWAMTRLRMQGVQVERLSSSVGDIDCEVLTIERTEPAGELQNHKLRRFEIKSKRGSQTLDGGTFVVRTAQPLGTLAGYMLEPESEDGLAAWDFFAPDARTGNAFPVVRVLATLPADKLTRIEEIPAVERLTLERIMQPSSMIELSTTSNNAATWLDGTNELVLKRDDRWLSVDPATGSSQPSSLIQRMRDAFAKLDAFAKSTEALDRIGPNILSAEQKFGLHSHQNDLYLFDSENNAARRLTDTPKQEETLAELSPTGQHVAFVRDNNLYIVDCSTGQQRQLTHDGSSELLNGILDWVYQEEIYGRGQFKAHWFSPDGQRLAFLQLDQTPVHRYQVSDSISYRQELEETRYPKAGDPLPVARVWLGDVTTGQLQQVDLTDYPPGDRLVVRVTWSPANELWLQIQNRIQTEQSLVRVNLPGGEVKRVLHEKSPGWIEVLGQPKFLAGGDFLWLSDLPAGRRHLHRFEQATQQLRQLTDGDWDIAELQLVTPDGRTAFVTGNFRHPTETHLLRVDTQSGKTERVTKEPGSHRPRLSHDGSFMIDSWSSLDQPPRSVLRSLDGNVERVLGAPVVDRYKVVQLAQPQLTTIMARDGLPMQTMIMLPTEVQGKPPEQMRKFPVLFHVYAGPQAPTVNNGWAGSNYWWHQYLCSQGYALILCDNRSSRGRGIADTWKIHRDMGRVELQDIEDAVEWVKEQPWADGQRIGIWGWSYGGYMTAYALTHSQSFQVGIAGAPVTDWRNYDAIYTERYMDLPQNNEAGYKSSSAVEAAANLHGRLLLLHGERDDNVHLSNTLQLAYALQKAAKPFDMMIYPKNRHGIVDPAQRYHMYQRMTEFLDAHLKGCEQDRPGQ